MHMNIRVKKAINYKQWHWVNIFTSSWLFCFQIYLPLLQHNCIHRLEDLMLRSIRLDSWYWRRFQTTRCTHWELHIVVPHHDEKWVQFATATTTLGIRMISAMYCNTLIHRCYTYLAVPWYHSNAYFLSMVVASSGIGYTISAVNRDDPEVLDDNDNLLVWVVSIFNDILQIKRFLQEILP